jgi:pimeloyl-ACP methyl ester carboxylesterase
MQPKWVTRLVLIGTILLALFLAFLAWAIGYIWTRPPPLQSQIEPKGAQFFEAEGIGRVAYWKIEATAPKKSPIPILYLQGGPGIGISKGTVSFFSKQFPDFDIYFLDQIGVGASDRLPQSRLTLENSVTSIHQFSKEIIRQPVILYGGSWGAGIATRVSIAHPEIAKALVLVAPISLPETCAASDQASEQTCFKTKAPKFVASLEPQPLQRLSRDTKTLVAQVNPRDTNHFPNGQNNSPVNRLWLSYIVAPASPWLSEKLVPLSQRKLWEKDGESYEVNFVLKRQHFETPISANKSSAEMPVLVLRGSIDFIPTEEIGGYQVLFPRSRFIEFDKETHELDLERCAVFLELRRFLALNTGSAEPISCVNQLVPVPNMPDAYTMQTIAKFK